MSTEVWIRNPAAAIKEAVEVGASNYIWDFSYLDKRHLDPVTYVDPYRIGMEPHRTLILGFSSCREYGPLGIMNKPRAVYPSWRYGEDFDLLERYITEPVSNDPENLWWQEHSTFFGWSHPSPKQEHRVVISKLPDSKLAISKQFVRLVAELQEENPECIVHLHGIYSYRPMFGLGLRATDIDARGDAAHGVVRLPSGRRIQWEEAGKHKMWVNLMGFEPKDLSVPRNRCMFNIKSAMWAGKHYQQNLRFAVRRQDVADYEDPDDPFLDAIEDDEIMMKSGVRAKRGDKWLCNTCSLQFNCKFFREGAVCAVPESEPQELAEFFKTRNSDDIIDGLATLVAANTRRLNRAIKQEEDNFEKKGLDPEVTTLITKIFNQGRDLAKLVNPALSAPKLQFTLNQNKTQIAAANPQQLMAAVTQELMARGIPMSAITPDMVMQVVAAPEEQQGAIIEAQVVAVQRSLNP